MKSITQAVYARMCCSALQATQLVYIYIRTIYYEPSCACKEIHNALTSTSVYANEIQVCTTLPLLSSNIHASNYNSEQGDEERNIMELDFGHRK